MAVAYINLYLSGYYHRLGKPDQFNIHPGDMYPTREAAEADCHPKELYVGTFPVLLGALGNTLVPNPPDAVPIDLETSREAYASFGIAALVDLITQHCGHAPLQLDAAAEASAQIGG